MNILKLVPSFTVYAVISMATALVFVYFNVDVSRDVFLKISVPAGALVFAVHVVNMPLMSKLKSNFAGDALEAHQLRRLNAELNERARSALVRCLIGIILIFIGFTISGYAYFNDHDRVNNVLFAIFIASVIFSAWMILIAFLETYYFSRFERELQEKLASKARRDKELKTLSELEG